jgi:hypothetical protein
MGRREMQGGFLIKKPEGIERLQDLGIDVRIILKIDLKMGWEGLE